MYIIIVVIITIYIYILCKILTPAPQIISIAHHQRSMSVASGNVRVCTLVNERFCPNPTPPRGAI